LLDAWVAWGAEVRAHIHLVADELAVVYHLAAEERFGQSPGLQAVQRIVSGDVVNDVERVQREVFSFYEAVFQGCHSAAVGAAAPVDSRTPFVRDESLFPMFHTG
jgi:hypothetical protein